MTNTEKMRQATLKHKRKDETLHVIFCWFQTDGDKIIIVVKNDCGCAEAYLANDWNIKIHD